MFKLFDTNGIADIFCDTFEPACIRLACADLQSDLRKVSGQTATLKQYLPYEETGCIVVGSLENDRFVAWLAENTIDAAALAGQWEHYLMRTTGNRLVIVGSDRRGAMWGVYDLCAQYLGVDPMVFWTDNEPAPRPALQLDDLDVIDGPKTYRFRGWFLNDEDYLVGWKDGGGTRYIHYKHYHQVTHQDVLAAVIETALRLKQNLIIPASFVDIDNPAEENMVRMASERGLFVTQHHVEPMGVSHFGWDNFWAKRGAEKHPSFVTNPDDWKTIWTHYAEKWARYDNVIWQFGLRGRGDRPVWAHDPNVPVSMAERGALISAAMQAQEDIVAQVLGHRDFISTTTLWMEGSELMADGYLTFPETTIILFSDHGATQMMLGDFFEVERDPARAYGGYFHVAFWGAGPRMAEGTSLDKLTFNFREAVSKGDTAYAILNVGNVREFPVGIGAVAQMTWDFAAFDPAVYLDRWITQQFGAAALDAVRAVYTGFLNAYPKLGSTLIPDHYILLDGMARQRGLEFLDIINDVPRDTSFGKVAGRWAAIYQGPTPDDPAEYVAFYREVLATGLANWQTVYAQIYAALPLVKPDRQPYFKDHFVLQWTIITGLYRWAYHLACAADAKLQGEGYVPHVQDAAHTMRQLLIDRQQGEQGKWQHWYRGDTKMDLPELLVLTEAVLI